MSVTKDDFDFIAKLAHEQAAIVIEAGKEYLVESRLTDVAINLGLGGLPGLVQALRAGKDATIVPKVIDALTTNETLFFRDFHPFEALKKTIVPELIAKRAESKQLSIWCGACSTGQEPYSIAMLLREHFPALNDWKINILATDLSPRVLKAAETGSFSQLEVNRGLPAMFLVKYFSKEADRWQIKDSVRNLITFRQMNLMQPWPVMQPFDLVFLRNVMIYFDIATKKMILKRIRGCLLPHGYLFLGSAETTLNLDPAYHTVNSGATVYYSASTAPAGQGPTTTPPPAPIPMPPTTPLRKAA